MYLALDPLANREVAVKVIRFQGDPTPYLEEVRNLARLDHPSIVRFYTVDLVEGRLLMVTEVVKGESLRTVLSWGKLERKRALKIARELLEALDHAHERGVIHRDVKPENIMLTPGGRVKVLDFGLSRLAQEDLSMSMGGTPAYMAPESWRGEFSPASDQWGAAVVILEMLTGINPFMGGTLEEVREKVFRGVSEERLVSLLPEELAHPLLRALSLDPGERYPSCRDFAQELLGQEEGSLVMVVGGAREVKGLPPLTKEQKQAAEDPSPRVLVTGGPGTGKTTVLLGRAVHLVESGEPPESIVLLTFSFRGWKEMEARLREAVGRVSRDLWVGNFHHIALRIVARFGDLVGLPREFSLALPSQQEELLREAAARAGGEKVWEEILRVYRHSRTTGLPWDQVVSQTTGRWRKMLEDFHHNYLHLIREKGSLGYEDLVYFALRVLEREEAARFYGERLGHVLVDEAQDLDGAQIALVEALALGGSLFITGDDDQSIYQWRGARPFYLREALEKGFSHHQLTQTFRLPPEFRELALALISHNRERMPKLYWTSQGEGGARFVLQPLKTPRDEGEYVADMIEILRVKKGYSYSDFAVLYRVKARGRLMEQVFKKRGVPYTREGGRVLLFREEVQCLMDFLAFLARGKGPRLKRRVLQGASSLVGRDGLEALEGLMDALDPGVRPSQALELAGEVLFSGSRGWDPTLLVTRMEAVEGLLERARDFEGAARVPTIANFLKYLKFLMDAGLAGGEEGVRLLTLHGAKGLEFPAVFLVGMVEGEFPLARALGVPEELEEERRLCYTAITRATRVLFVTYYQYSSPQARFMETPSSFIEEMLGTLA